MGKNEARRKDLADKYPEVEQHFQEIRQDMFKPQIEHLGENAKKQE